jgi:hypothetical protein
VCWYPVSCGACERGGTEEGQLYLGLFELRLVEGAMVQWCLPGGEMERKRRR